MAAPVNVAKIFFNKHNIRKYRNVKCIKPRPSSIQPIRFIEVTAKYRRKRIWSRRQEKSWKRQVRIYNERGWHLK